MSASECRRCASSRTTASGSACCPCAKRSRMAQSKGLDLVECRRRRDRPCVGSWITGSSEYEQNLRARKAEEEAAPDAAQGNQDAPEDRLTTTTDFKMRHARAVPRRARQGEVHDHVPWPRDGTHGDRARAREEAFSRSWVTSRSSESPPGRRTIDHHRHHAEAGRRDRGRRSRHRQESAAGSDAASRARNRASQARPTLKRRPDAQTKTNRAAAKRFKLRPVEAGDARPLRPCRHGMIGKGPERKRQLVGHG